MPLSEKHRAKLNEELDVERKLYGQTDKPLRNWTLNGSSTDNRLGTRDF